MKQGIISNEIVYRAECPYCSELIPCEVDANGAIVVCDNCGGEFECVNGGSYEKSIFRKTT